MKKHQSGLSLIEALISVAILTIGLLAASKLQIYMGVATQLSGQRVYATMLATSQMESMRSSGTCAPLAATTYTPAQSTATYTMTVTCTNTKTPKVVVTWDDARGTQTKVAAANGNPSADNKVELNTQL